MRTPVNAVIYLASLGMLALAGKLFMEATPALQGKPIGTFAEKGLKEASTLVQRGRGLGRQEVQYPYHREPWWRRFKDTNWIGKEEVVESDTPTDPIESQPVEQVATPIEEIIELIHLMYDGSDTADDLKTHVVVRYRQVENVEVPLELMPSPSTGAPMPRDIAKPRTAPNNRGRGGRGGAQRNGRGGTNPRATTPIPTASFGGSDEIVHFVKVGDSLWKPYDNISLKRVATDCESAFFVRTRPGDEPDQEPVEEELVKNTMSLDPELADALAKTRREARSEARAKAAGQRAAAGGSTGAGSGSWVDVQETRLVDGRYQIARGEAVFSENSTALDNINVRAYEPRFGDKSLRGLQVLNVDSKIARRFGIQQNDVILKINGQPIRSKADAINKGKKLYNRGVRTFTVTIMSGGRIEDRVYQAPDE